MKKLLFTLLFIAFAPLLANAGGCPGGCSNAKLVNGCIRCVLDDLLGGCTCSLSGGTPTCHDTGEVCGACNGFPQCDAYWTKQCCNIYAKQTLTSSWISKVDFSGIVAEMRLQPKQLMLADIVEDRHTFWNTAEQCGHLRGLHKVSEDSAVKYEVIANPNFLEVILHSDKEESFTVRNTGEWVVIKDHHRVALGQSGIMK